MNIRTMIDIEDEVRQALSGYVTAYCRPLPKDFSLPSVEVRKIGASETNTINTFMVMLYSRAETEAEADELLRKCMGLLDAIAKEQTTAIRFVTINAGGAWAADPVRPELAMCTATLMITVHTTYMEVKS